MAGLNDEPTSDPSKDGGFYDRRTSPFPTLWLSPAPADEHCCQEVSAFAERIAGRVGRAWHRLRLTDMPFVCRA
eukprot:365988-Chlamydomonas_euryale.AAC.10